MIIVGLAKPDRIICWENTPRGKSDHNFISVTLRTKDKIINSQEVIKRHWKSFTPESFRDKIGTLDWKDFYKCDNIDLLNSMFVDKVGGILEEMAPMKSFQTRKSYSNWMDPDTLQHMRDRDTLRDKARESDLDAGLEGLQNCQK